MTAETLGETLQDGAKAIGDTNRDVKTKALLDTLAYMLA